MSEISTGVILALVTSCAWSLFDLERRFLSMRIEAMALVAGVTLGALPPLAIWAAVSGPQQAQASYWMPATGSGVCRSGRPAFRPTNSRKSGCASPPAGLTCS